MRYVLHWVEREKWVDNFGCLLREAMRRNSVLDRLRVRQFDDIQDEISEIVDCRSEIIEGKFWE